MKYCTHCGAEIEDEAAICVHCGCATNDNKVKSSSNSNLGKIAKIFMIIACVINPLSGISQCMSYFESPGTVIVGIFGVIISLATLAWCIPMTIYFSRKLKDGEPVSTAFKVCSLLFVSLVAGILMFCMPSDDNKK